MNGRTLAKMTWAQSCCRGFTDERIWVIRYVVVLAGLYGRRRQLLLFGSEGCTLQEGWVELRPRMLYSMVSRPRSACRSRWTHMTTRKLPGQDALHELMFILLLLVLQLRGTSTHVLAFTSPMLASPSCCVCSAVRSLTRSACIGVGCCHRTVPYFLSCNITSHSTAAPWTLSCLPARAFASTSWKSKSATQLGAHTKSDAPVPQSIDNFTSLARNGKATVK